MLFEKICEEQVPTSQRRVAGLYETPTRPVLVGEAVVE